MRVHYLQHAKCDGPGSIRNALRARGHTLTSTQLYLDEALPSIRDFDWLIILGGDMGVYDEEAFPWLVREKAFIRVAIAESQACPNQGFIWGGRIVGLQFHPEITPEDAETFLFNCDESLETGPYIQSSDKILSNGQGFEQSSRIMKAVLEAMERAGT